MKTVFLGSGEFSRDLLHDLLGSGFEISAVITRPDRPAGRGLRLKPTAVKILAESKRLGVFQPDGPTDPAFLEALDELRPGLLLVADYGYMLPRDILVYPPHGCVNVHPSMLPHYRGAAPIQRALMHGDSETGVTLMVLDEGMDTGDIIARREIAIEDADDAASLREKLASLGCGMILEYLPSFISGDIVPWPQEEETATYADPIRRPDTMIDWGLDARSIHNQVRALSPRPGAYTDLGGKRLKIMRTIPCDDMAAGAPGEIIPSARGTFVVGTGAGVLQIEELQPEGKKPMTTAEFLRGYRPREGEFLGKAQPQ